MRQSRLRGESTCPTAPSAGSPPSSHSLCGPSRTPRDLTFQSPQVVLHQLYHLLPVLREHDPKASQQVGDICGDPCPYLLDGGYHAHHQQQANLEKPQNEGARACPAVLNQALPSQEKYVLSHRETLGEKLWQCTGCISMPSTH